MTRALILIYCFLVASAAAYWGRFRVPFRRGSKTDIYFGRINLVFNALMGVLALILPAASGFIGLPVLSYAAATLTLGSLVLYRYKSLGLHARAVHAGGRRAIPLTDQEKTRWPYSVSYTVGYAVMTMYVWSILPYAF
jgi:hypothetical protein